MVTENIKELPGYSSNFTVLPAMIIEEIYNGRKDSEQIQSQINQISNETLRKVLQANLNQNKLNATEYLNQLPFAKTQEYTKNIYNDKSILPFKEGEFLPFSSFVRVKEGNRYYVTIAYVAYSNTKDTSLTNSNKGIYGISVFNIYNNGEIEPLYISCR
ncbi:MAG: hypothetical protein ACRDDY_09635 [Clostridium sp.]|uniref:hypothetical protein n=1 Tax=Clostridium sp. TaxID=1506 RepID=UPI003EE61DAE